MLDKSSSISIIIPTYNGAHKIGNTIKALEEQTHKEFEVIIVVDGSNDNTAELLRSQGLNFKDFKIIWQENKGRASARNKGAIEATGELLIFFDDDMSPMEDCVVQHCRFHRNYKNAVLCGNPMEKAEFCTSDILCYKRSLSIKWTKKYKMGLNKLNFNNLFFTAANCSMSKNIFNKIGGFDERLTDIEDYDFAISALNKNINVFFNKAMIAWHNDHITCRNYIKRRREYNQAKSSLSQLKPFITLDNKNPGLFSRMKNTFLFLFAKTRIVELIDNDFFIFLPRVVRFKLYEWVIYSLGEVYTNKKL